MNLKQIGKSELSVIIYILYAVVFFLVGSFALKLPMLVVVLVIVIEGGLSFCLHKVPLWMHVVVIVCELALGIYTKNVIFMILGAAQYFGGVIALSFWLHREEPSSKEAPKE